MPSPRLDTPPITPAAGDPRHSQSHNPCQQTGICRGCGQRSVCLQTGAGRTMPYRNLAALAIPDDLPLPTCRRCRKPQLAPETKATLAEALSEQYRAELRRRVRSAIETLSAYISQHRLEALIGLSHGYLSRLRHGKGDPSPELVSHLAALARDPKARLQELERYWNTPGSSAEPSPTQTAVKPRPTPSGVLPLLLALLLLGLASPSAAQTAPPDAAQTLPLRDLGWALPPAPLGAHCTGSVVCTDLGTWGVHLRLTGSTFIRDDRSVPGGLLTPAGSFTLGGWGEAGVQFPILMGPLGTPPLPLPVILFGKGAFTPPSWIGTHGVLFVSLTMPHGPFSAPNDSGQPMASRYEVGAAISGHLLWMFHYGLSLSGQLSPGGAPPRLLSGVELRARFDGFNAFGQLLHSAAFCKSDEQTPACQSSLALLFGLQIPFVAGHTSVAAGPVRGAPGQEGTAILATLGVSYDETTRAKYGDGIAKVQQLWVRLFNAVIDPYLDERCVLWDDDHTPMVELGRKTADGMHCERDGLRTPIHTHFDRDQANTRVCYDKGLRNCVLHRRSDKDAWQTVPPNQQARRPYLKDDCHVYEEGTLLPLQQLGIKSADGQACEWEGHRFPIGPKFWAVPGDDVLCQDPTLKDCSVDLPPKPMTTGQYALSRAEQGLVHGLQKTLDKAERVPPKAKDLASDGVHIDTWAGEAYETLKAGLGHLSVEDAKKKAQAIVEAGKEWKDKPLHEQLGDLAEAAGAAPVDAIENEITGGIGNLASGMATVAGGAQKAEHAAARIEHAVADAARAGKKTVDAAVHEVPAVVPKPTGRGKNHLEPNKAAQGPHTTFRRGEDYELLHHAEWKPNPRQPRTGFDEVKRIDLVGDTHVNKKTGELVKTPHTHDKSAHGGVRSSTPDELPENFQGTQ